MGLACVSAVSVLPSGPIFDLGRGRRYKKAIMGGEPWYYFVAYQKDLQRALDELREREFRAGRYNPVVRFPQFPISGDAPGPGAGHRSIEAALEASDADGTRSILDMNRVGTDPDYGVVVQYPKESLVALYGTDKPTKDMVVGNMDFLNDVERGQGIYIVAYKDDKPAEIFFAGYSFD